MLVRMANREDPDQTASSGSALFVKALLKATSIRNFRAFTVIKIKSNYKTLSPP